MFGEIWTKDGKNITAEKKTELASAKLKDVPLDKAVKSATGETRSSSLRIRIVLIAGRHPRSSKGETT